MAHFPDTPSFTGFNTPSRIEADIADLQHTGTIPPELDGAFHRVQPDPQFPPRLGDDISFNGDGMITRFHFHDGQCDFRQRWAQTDKWKLETSAGKALFGAYRNPLTDDEAVKAGSAAPRTPTPSRSAASCGRSRRTARRSSWTRRAWRRSATRSSPAR